MSFGEKFEIRQSRLHGKGVFATRQIKAGEVVFNIQGKILNLQAFFSVTQKIRDNTYRLGQSQYLSPQGQAGQFVNHSCDPNAKIVKKKRRLYLVCLRGIKKGDEITFDYSTTLAKDDFWVMNCSCGSQYCRGKIKRYNLLPKNVLEKYLKEKIIPEYIVKIPEEE